MKRITLSLLFLLSLTMSWAQNYSVNPQEASMEDYVKLLNFVKYEAFSSDILCRCCWLIKDFIFWMLGLQIGTPNRLSIPSYLVS